MRKNGKKRKMEESKHTNEEQLDINELLNVQGGVNEDSTDCGLGCYMGGLDPGNQHERE